MKKLYFIFLIFLMISGSLIGSPILNYPIHNNNIYPHLWDRHIESLYNNSSYKLNNLIESEYKSITIKLWDNYSGISEHKYIYNKEGLIERYITKYFEGSYEDNKENDDYVDNGDGTYRMSNSKLLIYNWNGPFELSSDLTFKYDIEGRLLDIVNKGVDIYTPFFNSRDQLIKVKMRSQYDRKEEETLCNYFYDYSGNLSEIKIGEKKFLRYLYKNGLLTTLIGDGYMSNLSRDEYIYDEKNNLQEISHHDVKEFATDYDNPTEDDFNIYTELFDDNGYLVDTFYYSMKYEFDEYDRVIKYIRISSWSWDEFIYDYIDDTHYTCKEYTSSGSLRREYIVEMETW